jgi:phosphonate transport system permease protein
MSATAAASPARPPRPRRSVTVPIGILAFIAITWAALSAEIGIGLDVLEILSDLGNGARIWAEFLEPNWAFLPQTARPMLETVQMAIVASVLGCSLALPVSFLASRVTSPNVVSFVANRGILSVVRAIPDLLYALVFVAAVGIGALAGVLALLLFSIGVTAKLLSETVDGVDAGPIESARASGGGRLQIVRWSVLPQVLPNYVAYSLYVFELNVRASTVIGLVGAGGIGRLLNTERVYFRYENVSVIVIELFLFVFLIELGSIWLRRRLV